MTGDVDKLRSLVALAFSDQAVVVHECTICFSMSSKFLFQHVSSISMSLLFKFSFYSFSLGRLRVRLCRRAGDSSVGRSASPQMLLHLNPRWACGGPKKKQEEQASGKLKRELKQQE